MSGYGLIGGWAADLLLGDPRRWHPVAAFGSLALALERRVYAPSRARGALFAAALVALAGLAGELAARCGERVAARCGRRLAAWCSGGLAAVAGGAWHTDALRPGAARALALGMVTWAALGGRSLVAESRRISALLSRGDLDGARERLPALVGRDAAGLDEAQIARAVVESLAENTADAVAGALLWGALAGPAGVAAFRAANTLDAMVGHRNERYARFGWAAARLDDLLVWPAARLGAGLAALCAPVAGGSPARAWRTLRRDGALHPSPNSGRMEAAFAGALGVRLGGPLAYAGRCEERPVMGGGREPSVHDVARAARLSLAAGALSALLCAGLRMTWDGKRA